MDKVDNARMLLSLVKAYNWLEESVRDHVQACGSPELTRSQAILIANIILGYRHQSEIARQADISRQAVHVVIQQMVAKGIIELDDDPDHGKAKRVELTKLGKKMRDDGVQGMAFATAELGKRIGRANVTKLAKLLNADWGPPPSARSRARS